MNGRMNFTNLMQQKEKTKNIKENEGENIVEKIKEEERLSNLMGKKERK